MKKLFLNSLAVLVIFLASCSKENLNLGGGGGWNWGVGWGMPGGGPIAGNYFYNTALHFINTPWYGYSYYIYKDSATGFTDSLIVSQNYTQNVFHDSVPGNPPIPKFTHETFKLRLQQKTGSPGQIWFDGFASCDTQYRNTANFIDSDFELTDMQNNLPAFWYPFTNVGANTYSLIPSITIEGTLYVQVHKFSSTNGLLPADINYRQQIYYWEKGTGIIKREIKTNNSVKTSMLVRRV